MFFFPFISCFHEDTNKNANSFITKRVVSQYRDYKNRDGQSWDRQFRDYCEIFFTVTANIVTANHMIVTAN